MNIERIRDLAQQILAEIGAPTIPEPPPPPPPPPPTTGPASAAEVTAAAQAAGYAGAVLQVITVPANGAGLNTYLVSPRVDQALVIAFQAPPPDLCFEISYVRLPGAGGSRTMILSARHDAYDPRGPGVIWTSGSPVPDLSVRVATMPSPYTRYQLTPGAWYYVLCTSRLPIDPSLPTTQPLSIKVLNARP